MKNALIIALMIFTANSFAKEINIKVSGMVCSMCAQGIKKKFSQVKEVKEINVNLDNKFVQLKTEGETDVTDDKIKSIITEAGYNVASIERK